MNSPGILHVALPLHQVAQPGDALIVGRRPLAPLLVLPVRGDALLGDAVHLLGADLHLEGLPVRPHHRSVQRLVEIGPRDGDEVLDAAGDGPPLVVNHAQRGVAVLHRIGDDAQRHQVVDLVDGDLLPAQLLEDRVGALDAAFDARRNAFVAQLRFHRLADFGQELLVRVAARFDGLRRSPGRRPAPGTGRPGPPVRRALCPCPGGARWARRSRWSRGRCARAAPALR